MAMSSLSGGPGGPFLAMSCQIIELLRTSLPVHVEAIALRQLNHASPSLETEHEAAGGAEVPRR
eukprot:754902-Hanusia_phi.AAC.4